MGLLSDALDLFAVLFDAFNTHTHVGPTGPSGPPGPPGPCGGTPISYPMLRHVGTLREHDELPEAENGDYVYLEKEVQTLGEDNISGVLVFVSFEHYPIVEAVAKLGIEGNRCLKANGIWLSINYPLGPIGPIGPPGPTGPRGPGAPAPLGQTVLGATLDDGPVY